MGRVIERKAIVRRDRSVVADWYFIEICRTSKVGS